MKRWASCWPAIAILAAVSFSATAQRPAKVFRIGILSPAASSSTKAFDAFRDGLRELGYIEGATIKIEYRLAAWDYSRLSAMAADLVRLPVDVIVTDGRRAAQTAQKATRTFPIVAATAGADPVAAGLAVSLAHPGANLTGFTGAGGELSGKRVQLLKEAVPGVSRIAALRSPEIAISNLQATEEAARTFGLDLRIVEVAVPGEIPSGFEAAVGAGAEALVVLPDAMFWNERFRIIALAAQHRLPSIYKTGHSPPMVGCLATAATFPSNSDWRRGMSTRS
jgi:putative ABC transport system substrate-binding protein